MAERYEVDQSASRVSGPGVVIRQEITIINELGLHARPAAEFVLAAKAFRSQIWLVKGEERFSAASILEVLCANLNCGDTATIEAEGRDAEEAVRRLADLIRGFGKRDSNSPSIGRVKVEEGDSMPPPLRKLLLPLLFEVAASPLPNRRLHRDVAHGRRTLLDAALHFPAHAADEASNQGGPLCRRSRG
jgi:phosphocarrier protein HPr